MFLFLKYHNSFIFKMHTNLYKMLQNSIKDQLTVDLLHKTLLQQTLRRISGDIC
jgi:hypothetical protein